MINFCPCLPYFLINFRASSCCDNNSWLLNCTSLLLNTDAAIGRKSAPGSLKKKKNFLKLVGWIDLLAAEPLEQFIRDYGALQWWEWGWDTIYSSNTSTNIVTGSTHKSKFLSKINDAEKAAKDMCMHLATGFSCKFSFSQHNGAAFRPFFLRRMVTTRFVSELGLGGTKQNKLSRAVEWLQFKPSSVWFYDSVDQQRASPQAVWINGF